MPFQATGHQRWSAPCLPSSSDCQGSEKKVPALVGAHWDPEGWRARKGHIWEPCVGLALLQVRWGGLGQTGAYLGLHW